jgi:SAM-dependent methyltransferase
MRRIVTLFDDTDMSTSIIYKSPLFYEVFLLIRYRGKYRERSAAIADLIPGGSTVVDLCCGPATLYFNHLRAKQVSYIGLDINRGFVDRLTARGVKAYLWDVGKSEPLPQADYLVMQGSLYHFLPDPYPIVDRMLAAARRGVLLTEPVRNLADSKNPFLSWMASKLANPGTGDQANRFNEPLFEEFVSHYRVQNLVLGYYPIAGGREQLCILCDSHLQEHAIANR